jgi:hypothetical protein
MQSGFNRDTHALVATSAPNAYPWTTLTTSKKKNRHAPIGKCELVDGWFWLIEPAD